MGFLDRTAMILGEANLRLLRDSHVAVFGLGGVGGAAVEALARLGIGTFTLIDPDAFNETNLNRQILSTREVLGQKKVEVAKARILSINPDAKVITHPIFFLPEQEDGLDFSKFDFVIDAIDTIAAKREIIRRCLEAGTPLACSMGTGNRTDPSKIVEGDIFDTKDDPLAKIMRKHCRELGVKSLPVVFSLEKPLEPLVRVKAEGVSRRDVPGSLALVPPVAGYMLTHIAFKALVDLDNRK